MSTRKLIALERFGGPEVMRWVEAEAPEPGPDEVAVAVEAIGINFGDTMVRRGEYRRDQPLDFTPASRRRVGSSPRPAARPRSASG